MPTAERGGPCGCEACVTVSRVAYTILPEPFRRGPRSRGLLVHMATAYGWEGPWENEIEEEAAKEMGLDFGGAPLNVPDPFGGRVAAQLPTTCGPQ